jgi:hypothetical protein
MTYSYNEISNNEIDIEEFAIWLPKIYQKKKATRVLKYIDVWFHLHKFKKQKEKTGKTNV